MLIYSPELSTRLQYILEVIFGRLLGVNYRLTNMDQEFIHFHGPKLCYSFEPLDDAPFIKASGLLFEPLVCNQSDAIGKVFYWRDLPAFYPAASPSVLPFDIFSASFYLLSRYEEYLPFTADEYGRFPASASMAFRHHFLQQPLINLWVKELEEWLRSAFPEVVLSKPAYQFIPTIDIDNAWAFRHKGWRTLLNLFRFAPMPTRNYRYQVIRRNQPDPYDQYDFLDGLLSGIREQAVFFFLLGKTGPFDRNVNPRNHAMQELIRRMSEKYRVGIHPSWRSNDENGQLEEELKTLRSITEKEVLDSRQHYLRFRLPMTYRKLAALGIQREYSMGYPEQVGFRASIAHPFPFFDLDSNLCSDMLIVPFQVMDVTLRQYLDLTPVAAEETIRSLIQQVKEVNGVFSVLWHNESLSEWDHWQGWSGVFRKTIELAGS